MSSSPRLRIVSIDLLSAIMAWMFSYPFISAIRQALFTLFLDGPRFFESPLQRELTKGIAIFPVILLIALLFRLPLYQQQRILSAKRVRDDAFGLSVVLCAAWLLRIGLLLLGTYCFRHNIGNDILMLFLAPDVWLSFPGGPALALVALLFGGYSWGRSLAEKAH